MPIPNSIPRSTRAIARRYSRLPVCATTTQHRLISRAIAAAPKIAPDSVLHKDNHNINSYHHPNKRSYSTGWTTTFPSASEPINIMVIGSSSVSLLCNISHTSAPSTSIYLRTSHPSSIRTSAGGVAHNVALATSYASNQSVRLVTAISTDPEGAWLKEIMAREGLDVRFISGRYGAETAKSVTVHDKDGELVVATADTGIIEGFSESELRRELQTGRPRYVAFDGCISPDSVNAILEECGRDTSVLFEPTSVAKASVIFEDPVKLGVYPTHSIDLITPNLYELKAMFKAAEKKHLFEGIEWWDMLDSFNLTSQFRQDVEFLMRKVSRQHRHRSLDDPQELEYNIESHVPQDEHELKLGRDLMGEGALQQAVALLPYIPNVVVKLGSLGILCVRLCPKDTQLKDTDASTLRFPGRKADVVVQHHRGLPQKGFVSVTGAGDTFAGVLIAKLAGGGSIEEAVDMAQKAVVMTLASSRTVSEQIVQLRT